MRWIIHCYYAMQFHAIVLLAKPYNVIWLGVILFVIVPAHGLSAQSSRVLLVVVAMGVGTWVIFRLGNPCDGCDQDIGVQWEYVLHVLHLGVASLALECLFKSDNEFNFFKTDAFFGITPDEMFLH